MSPRTKRWRVPRAPVSAAADTRAAPHGLRQHRARNDRCRRSTRRLGRAATTAVQCRSPIRGRGRGRRRPCAARTTRRGDRACARSPSRRRARTRPSPASRRSLLFAGPHPRDCPSRPPAARRSWTAHPLSQHHSRFPGPPGDRRWRSRHSGSIGRRSAPSTSGREHLPRVSARHASPSRRSAH